MFFCHYFGLAQQCDSSACSVKLNCSPPGTGTQTRRLHHFKSFAIVGHMQQIALHSSESLYEAILFDTVNNIILADFAL